MAFKVMNRDFLKLDNFDGSNFTCWNEKVILLLVVLNISYILDINLQPLSSPSDKDTYNIIKERKKFEEDEVICRGHILNTLLDCLFDLYTSIKSPREI